MSTREVEPPSGDSLVVRLDEMLAELAGAVTDGSPTGDAARIYRIARLERLRAVTHRGVADCRVGSVCSIAGGGADRR
jgi:hypothetical protein